MIDITPSKIQEFQTHIWKRRAVNRRDFPWRHTRDPYQIWISETMLAQTQTSRVVQYFKHRIEQFPRVGDLAKASNTEVLKARSGLGYNSRGLRLREAARQIVAQAQQLGQGAEYFPSSYEALRALPGVGDYTASAVLAFAYHQDVAVIDTNIRRILIYHFHCDEKTSLQDLKQLALAILPVGYASDRYNALMDYGALEVTARRTGIKALTRQSKFEGSRRQVRAWIVKQLAHRETSSMERLEVVQHFAQRDDIDSILQQLVDEGILEYITPEQIRIREH